MDRHDVLLSISAGTEKNNAFANDDFRFSIINPFSSGTSFGTVY